MSDLLERRLSQLENRCRKLEIEARVTQEFQIAMMRLLYRRWRSAMTEVEEIAEQMRDAAKAAGLAEDERALDSLINQLDQEFGLPAND